MGPLGVGSQQDLRDDADSLASSDRTDTPESVIQRYRSPHGGPAVVVESDSVAADGKRHVVARLRRPVTREERLEYDIALATVNLRDQGRVAELTALIRRTHGL